MQRIEEDHCREGYSGMHFTPKNPSAFQELMLHFPPFLRASAWTFWDLALMRCTRESKDGGLQRGQFYYGRDEVERITGVSTKTLRTLESRLEKMGEFSRKSANKGTIGTIVNFDTYVIDGKGIGKPTANQRQTNGNYPKEKEKENTTTPSKKRRECIKYVASEEATRGVSAWARYRPLPEGVDLDTYHKTLDDMHRLDGVPWDGDTGIYAICRHAVTEWKTKHIQSPSKLRLKSTAYPELKTFQVIQNQLRAPKDAPVAQDGAGVSDELRAKIAERAKLHARG